MMKLLVALFVALLMSGGDSSVSRSKVSASSPPIVEKWAEWEVNATPYGGPEVLAKIRKAKESGSHFINLEASGIADIAPLMGLSEMGTLSLSGNQITDVTPLSDLNKLVHLVINDNQITDLTPLKGLTNLTKLYLPGNQITDLKHLAGLR